MPFLKRLDYDTASDPRMREYIEKAIKNDIDIEIDRKPIKIENMKSFIKQLLLLHTSKEIKNCIFLFSNVLCTTYRLYSIEIIGKTNNSCEGCYGCQDLKPEEIIKKIGVFIEKNT